jgi:murein DD-endopeptidase MepM/ murein hydrolase activator NlpD
MKPLHLILPAFLATPALVPLVSVFAEDTTVPSISDDFLAAIGTEPTKVAVAAPLASPEASAGSLDQPAEDPASSALIASRQSWGDPASDLGTTPVASTGSAMVRFGDTLRKFAERYGLTLAELIRLNPGLETARLVVGTELRVAQSAPMRSRSLLALNPVGSGGVSWPDLPRYGEQEQRPFRDAPSGNSWIWPTKGVFTSGYGWRWGRMHKGIDVANNVGTPIVAARSGTVTYSGWHDGGYGYLVEISHDDGSRSLYGHNSRLMVRQGERVEQGQQISQMGSTGRSTGPHLHFEIHAPGQGAANPLGFLPPRA